MGMEEIVDEQETIGTDEKPEYGLDLNEFTMPRPYGDIPSMGSNGDRMVRIPQISAFYSLFG